MLRLCVVVAILAAACCAQAMPSRRGDFSGPVVIDAGHGGVDPGTQSRTRVFEKNVNLAIARGVAAELRRQGIPVILTRTGDASVPLDERVGIANTSRARLFVSIHCDSNPDTSAKGFSIFVPRAWSPKAYSAAGSISRSLLSGGIPRHMLRQNPRSFEVLGANSPAVLVEVGFLSNVREASLLTDPTYQQRCASAIAAGIAGYLRNP